MRKLLKLMAYCIFRVQKYSIQSKSWSNINDFFGRRFRCFEL